MLRRTDRATGLTLTIEPDPAPRNPRLAHETLFHLVTWTRPRLGDPHAWSRPLDLVLAMRAAPALIVPIKVEWVPGGRPCFGTVLSLIEDPAGYAVATHERLRLHYGAREVTPELLEEARLACDVELLDYEQFLQGDVHAFTIAAREGRVLEHCCGLLGLDWAEAMAERAFEDHLARARGGAPGRRAA